MRASDRRTPRLGYTRSMGDVGRHPTGGDCMTTPRWAETEGVAR